MSNQDAQLRCPIHGEVEGLSLSEGPLSDCWPWVLVCEECEPRGTSVVVGYESDAGVFLTWEEVPFDE